MRRRFSRRMWHPAVKYNLPVRSQLLISLILLTTAAASPAQQVTMPLWPNGAPEPSTVTGPERDSTTPTDRVVGGRPVVRLTNVSKPTLAVYRPDAAKDTGAALLVFPGGAYKRLAIDLEGTEVCAWLNSLGMTCVLVKYRVPFDAHYPQRPEQLEDAQQAMRITRSHAAEWHIDPQRIGALGFSAGAHLAGSGKPSRLQTGRSAREPVEHGGRETQLCCGDLSGVLIGLSKPHQNRAHDRTERGDSTDLSPAD